MSENEPSSARVIRGRNRIRTGESEGADVRAHIQRVALDLFIEEGYDKTSLREIAEKLGVTKAALYYHFPTKDDIVASLIEERIAAVDALLDWAASRPRDSATRLEFIRRYASLHSQFAHENVIRFFERNQTVINTLPAGKRLREQMNRVMELLADPSESLSQQLRRMMALFSVHASWFMLRERPGTPEERRAAALEVASELMAAADRHGCCDPDREPGPEDSDRLPGPEDPDREPSAEDPDREPSAEDPDREPSAEDPDRLPGPKDPDREPGPEDSDREPDPDVVSDLAGDLADQVEAALSREDGQGQSHAEQVDARDR
ncbi:TetR family transcriptional regulator [Dactylosporangium sp. CA-139066]|uniref:TetR family transcriptional regulator n=1 Tax=Dactylosporangium sp. CA-139066 TaxID=3239930 RepID=UPI003D8FCA19